MEWQLIASCHVDSRLMAEHFHMAANIGSLVW